MIHYDQCLVEESFIPLFLVVSLFLFQNTPKNTRLRSRFSGQGPFTWTYTHLPMNELFLVVVWFGRRRVFERKTISRPSEDFLTVPCMQISISYGAAYDFSPEKICLEVDINFIPEDETSILCSPTTHYGGYDQTRKIARWFLRINRNPLQTKCI